jgi:hypothetical protein
MCHGPHSLHCRVFPAPCPGPCSGRFDPERPERDVHVAVTAPAARPARPPEREDAEKRTQGDAGPTRPGGADGPSAVPSFGRRDARVGCGVGGRGSDGPRVGRVRIAGGEHGDRGRPRAETEGRDRGDLDLVGAATHDERSDDTRRGNEVEEGPRVAVEEPGDLGLVDGVATEEMGRVRWPRRTVDGPGYARRPRSLESRPESPGLTRRARIRVRRAIVRVPSGSMSVFAPLRGRGPHAGAVSSVAWATNRRFT